MSKGEVAELRSLVKDLQRRVEELERNQTVQWGQFPTDFASRR